MFVSGRSDFFCAGSISLTQPHALEACPYLYQRGLPSGAFPVPSRASPLVLRFDGLAGMARPPREDAWVLSRMGLSRIKLLRTFCSSLSANLMFSFLFGKSLVFKPSIANREMNTLGGASHKINPKSLKQTGLQGACDLPPGHFSRPVLPPLSPVLEA